MHNTVFVCVECQDLWKALITDYHQLNWRSVSFDADQLYQLVLNEKGLWLYFNQSIGFKPWQIDFLDKSLQRRQHVAAKSALAKAMGYPKTKNKTMIDMTAGLGRDAFLLASLGYKVILCEQSPILVALLCDAFRRADNVSAISSIVSHMQLYCGNSVDYVNQYATQADIIYCDPMFPKTQSTAKVKKDMQIVRLINAEEKSSDDELIRAAISYKDKRIVIKRPRLGGELESHKPHHQILSDTYRFDVLMD